MAGDVRRPPGSTLKARRLGQIRDLVERGGVEVVLQSFEIERMPIYAVLSLTRTQPAKVKLFIDLLSAQVRSSGL